MKIEYYEDMLEERAINKYLNMIANDYGGELAKIFEEKYIKKDQELERLNNIIKDIKSQLDYLETYSSKEDVFEDMKRRLNRIESIVSRK